jgi:hypothetical protein
MNGLDVRVLEVSGEIGRDRRLPFAQIWRARASRYFITVSVRMAIDFTPPERLRSMASMAAA